MSAQHMRRIKEAQRETQYLIAKELTHQERLQKVEYLASLRKHAAKLDLMLAEFSAVRS